MEVEDGVISDHEYMTTGPAHDAEAVDLTTSHRPRDQPQSTMPHLIADHGEKILQYTVAENKLCQFSPYTGYHLQSGLGEMRITLTVKNAPRSKPLTIRASLIRKDPAYQQFGVTSVCEKHRRNEERKSHVLQATSGEQSVHYESYPQKRYVCFDLGVPDSAGNLRTTIGLRCTCNDTCQTCSHPNFQPREPSRDLLLTIALDSNDIQIAHRSLTIWPKAAITIRDLKLLVRRRPKGGRASQLTKAHMSLMEVAKHIQRTPDGVNLLKIACNSPAITLNGALNTTLDSAIKISKKLQLNREELLKRMSDRLTMSIM